MTIPIASLAGSPLPVQFSYTPAIPIKRNTTQATNTSVVVQSANSQIVPGEFSVNWRIQAATPLEFKELFDLWNTSIPTLYTFIGYWGENFGVYFTTLDEPTVRGRLFDMSGRFQVISVTSWYDPTCGF